MTRLPLNGWQVPQLVRMAADAEDKYLIGHMIPFVLRMLTNS